MGFYNLANRKKSHGAMSNEPENDFLRTIVM